MGVRINIDTNNENEFNQQLQIYLSQGYSLQSNFDGTAILKKKSYSVAILILLIIFVFPIGIIYYLVATDDIVTIRNNNGQAPNNNINLNSTTESFDSYCEDCGQGLFKSSKFCPKCGAKITGKTGFYSECGAVTTSLNNEIEETNEIIKEKKKIADLQRWYHKPDKDHKMAILYSIFLPFSGNFYLRENIINLLLTILSILFILGNIIGLLTIDDFYYRHSYLILIYSLLWIVSIFSLILIISNYKRGEVYFKKDEEKYSKESQLPNFFTKAYIKYIPFILVILFLIVNMGVTFSDSPKTFDTPDFSFNYPHEYISDGTWNYNPNLDEYSGSVRTGGSGIEIRKYPAYGPITSYVDDAVNIKDNSGNIFWHYNTYKGKTKVDNTEAYLVQDYNSSGTLVIFIKDKQVYYLHFKGKSQKDMNTILNSFKFK